MTTNIQLREWLTRFPDDAEIVVLTSEECAGYWDSYIQVYKEPLVLPNIQVEDLTWDKEYDAVVFDIQYDYEQPCCTIVKSITLGKAHND